MGKIQDLFCSVGFVSFLMKLPSDFRFFWMLYSWIKLALTRCLLIEVPCSLLTELLFSVHSKPEANPGCLEGTVYLENSLHMELKAHLNGLSVLSLELGAHLVK